MRIFTALLRIIGNAWKALFNTQEKPATLSRSTDQNTPISTSSFQYSTTSKPLSQISTTPNTRMEISETGIQMIKQHEGLRLTPYLDSAGLATIGYGHLIQSHESFDGITEEEAEKILRYDIKIAETAVNDLVKEELFQHEFDALVSFVFNIGRGNFKDSTILKRINNREHRTEPEMVYIEFGKWVYAKGNVIKGLQKRRLMEAEQFRSGKITRQYV